MQKVTGSLEYFKTICSGIDAASIAMDERPEPFCILSLVYRRGVPYDIMVLGRNRAFHDSVNKSVTVGQTIRRVSPTAIKFWLKALLVVEVTNKPVTLKDYTVSMGHLTFGKATAFPIALMGKVGVGLVLEEPRASNPCVFGEMCFKCPNNPSVKYPSLKMGEIIVSARVEQSACDLCRLFRSLPSQVPQ